MKGIKYRRYNLNLHIKIDFSGSESKQKEELFECCLHDRAASGCCSWITLYRDKKLKKLHYKTEKNRHAPTRKQCLITFSIFILWPSCCHPQHPSIID
ncbi:hypothetical protein XELAEV_18009632mg [Xenopus laevis]|uniref:Uncharacterized protein n=1 Tax=Xenopus laevis TaxID=8355 RepID=A0A974DSQ2_XENLA|nr:hypothetical protein XELAEV_18009632mg [Xenopus laevis]